MSSVAPSTVSNEASAGQSSAVDANTASRMYSSQYLNEAMTGDVSVAAARAKMHGIELWNMKFPTMGVWFIGFTHRRVSDDHVDGIQT